jgi:hypothetical protein
MTDDSFLTPHTRAHVCSPPIRHELRGGGPKERTYSRYECFTTSHSQSDAWHYDTQKNKKGACAVGVVCTRQKNFNVYTGRAAGYRDQYDAMRLLLFGHDGLAVARCENRKVQSPSGSRAIMSNNIWTIDGDAPDDDGG